MRKFLILILFINTASAFGQLTKVVGKISDQKTGEPLTGVSIYFVRTGIGTTTNFEGLFEISSISPSDSIIVSYVGYDEMYIPIFRDSSQEINVKLKIAAVVFKATVSGKVNRAIRVIKEAHKAKDKYNLENLNSYESENFTKIQIAIANR